LRARGIFLMRDGKPIVLNQQGYDSEDVFQLVLARFPEVLAGGTTTEGDEVRRLVLVSREMGVPATEGGSATWSLDHLFIDETGVPVFVEVKRSSDSRIRREVVGQMLDYAANGVAYWSIDTLKQSLLTASETAPEEALQAAFGGDVDVDDFWRTVEQNLREGNVRLVFVADRLPPELVRIIEFLNERMSPTEVLGVEVSQYVGEDEQLFVPELVGKTARAVTTKGKTQGRSWDEPSFLAAALERHGAPTEHVFSRLFDHVRERGGRFSCGRGVSPGVSGWYPVDGLEMPVWTANAGVYGSASDAPSIFIYPDELRARVGQERLDRWIEELEKVPGFERKLAEARAAGWTRKYPSCLLTAMAKSPPDQDQLLRAFDQVVDGVAARSASAVG
jgi:hypothetical protein